MTYAGMFEEMSCIKELKKLKKENKKLTDNIEKLKAELARSKEDHQYDNLVHKKELESLRKK
jgi:mRNA-degrading endonuclease RelE of RelBE toxin-antitoxin system